jgi:hypothetical protein
LERSLTRCLSICIDAYYRRDTLVADATDDLAQWFTAEQIQGVSTLGSLSADDVPLLAGDTVGALTPAQLGKLDAALASDNSNKLLLEEFTAAQALNFSDDAVKWIATTKGYATISGTGVAQAIETSINTTGTDGIRTIAAPVDTAGSALTGNGTVTITAGKIKSAITGSAVADSIIGSVGADTIVGGAGADTIVGGKGADKLTGGDGVDTFVYEPGDGVKATGVVTTGSTTVFTFDNGADVITDFKSVGNGTAANDAAADTIIYGGTSYKGTIATFTAMHDAAGDLGGTSASTDGFNYVVGTWDGTAKTFTEASNGIDFLLFNNPNTSALTDVKLTGIVDIMIHDITA